MLGSKARAARGGAHHQRNRMCPTVHIAPHTGLKEDFITRGDDKIGKLEFHHRPQAHRSRTHTGADHHTLGDRRIEHAIRTELLKQPIGDFENPAPDRNVLAVQDHVFIAPHFFSKRIINRLTIGPCGHKHSWVGIGGYA